MPDHKPRNILDPDNVTGLIIGAFADKPSRALASLLAGDFPTYTVEDVESPPWQDAAIWDTLEKISNTQLLILSETLGSYETALVVIALQKGFATYFVSPAISHDPEHRLARLRQASAIVMSPEDALSELRLSAPGKGS